MRDDLQKLTHVADGIGLVLLALALSILGALWMVLVPQFMASADFLVRLVVVAVGLILLLIGFAFDVLGRFYCLAMPKGAVRARRYLLGSLVFLVITLAIRTLDLIALFFPAAQPGETLVRVQMVALTLGGILFLLFLRELADYVDSPKVKTLASRVLILAVCIVAGSLLMAALILGAGLASLAGLFAVLVMIALIVFVCLYGRLLTFLRRQTLAYVSAVENGL